VSGADGRLTESRGLNPRVQSQSRMET